MYWQAFYRLRIANIVAEYRANQGIEHQRGRASKGTDLFLNIGSAKLHCGAFYVYKRLKLAGDCLLHLTGECLPSRGLTIKNLGK
jgi:hypothetical protein